MRPREVARTALRKPALVFLGCLAVMTGGLWCSRAVKGRRASRAPGITQAAQSSLRPESFLLHDRPVVRPAAMGSQLSGIFVILHGCSHSALDFWPRSLSCPDCVGLPEEVLLVESLVKMRYFPLAVSSTRRCWSPGSRDLGRIAAAINETVASKDLHGIPLFVFGASSGGMVASMLPSLLKVSGVVVQISAGVSEMFESNGADGGPYPPVAFIHMLRDYRTADRVAQNQKLLRARGVPCEQFEVKETAIHRSYFSTRSRAITDAESEQIFDALRDGSFLSPEYFLKEDPRKSAWRQHIQKRLPDIAQKDGLVTDQSQISELLNVAFAGHELTAQHVSDAVQFLEGHMQQQ
mmetsp:Transcript_3694/g.11029  ORF Transcript_3694/g.11029 Transcript_3694/m.11029 type:complete len:351 (+) Transcript_3694:222-1274(+)